MYELESIGHRLRNLSVVCKVDQGELVGEEENGSRPKYLYVVECKAGAYKCKWYHHGRKISHLSSWLRTRLRDKPHYPKQLLDMCMTRLPGSTAQSFTL